jgi:hypothetical protein
MVLNPNKEPISEWAQGALHADVGSLKRFRIHRHMTG